MNRTQRKGRPHFLAYNSVSSEMRFKLLSLLTIEKISVKEASDKLNINYQTAKSIIRRFKITGRIER